MYCAYSIGIKKCSIPSWADTIHHKLNVVCSLLTALHSTRNEMTKNAWSWKVNMISFSFCYRYYARELLFHGSYTAGDIIAEKKRPLPIFEQWWKYGFGFFFIHFILLCCVLSSNKIHRMLFIWLFRNVDQIVRINENENVMCAKSFKAPLSMYTHGAF